MVRRMMLAGLVAVVAAAGIEAQETLPAATVRTVAQPVRTARLFAPIVAADARGRWQFICQTMNYKGTTDFTFERQTVPGTDRQHLVFKEKDLRPDAEWVVLDLESGEFKVFDLPGFHGGAAVRAGNGRVFFFVDFMHVWYYEPADGQMKILGEISRWVPFTNDRSFYQTRLGADGNVYATTQSYSGKTAVIQIDPEALTWKIFADVGANRPAGLTYGYYMGLGLPWIYVGVGQDHWELMAVNVVTGEKRLLAERKGEGARVVVSDDGNGSVRAELIGGGSKEIVWCIDGKAMPVEAGAKPPRATAPAGRKFTPPPDAPELDKSRPPVIGNDGSAVVWWRPPTPQGQAADANAWRSATFRIQRAEPVPLESLTTLPDGSLLGNAYSYNGFFRYHPATGECDYFGKSGPSRVKTCLLDGKVYYAGYPNSHMSVYDPTRPWEIVDKATLTNPANNPMLIGTFGQTVTEAHYATVLLPGPNGRVYLVGKRERWSTGTGLGYYDLATKQRVGLGQDMKDYHALGAALLPKLGRIVISGKGPDDAGRFRVYDLELKPQPPLTLKPGLKSTGLVQGIDHDTHVLGWIEGKDHDTLYLYDVEKAAVVAWRELEKPADPQAALPGQASWWADIGGLRTRIAFQKPGDGSWWMLRGQTLCRLNTRTLDLTPVAALSRPFDLPVWSGDEIYGIAGGDVVTVAMPGS